jgi:hypothetical protein
VVSTSTLRIWADGVILAIFAFAAVTSLQGIDSPTYWFPAFVSITGTVVSAFNLGSDVRRVRAGQSLTEGEITDIGASLADTYDDDDSGHAPPSDEQSAVVKRVIAWSLWLVALPLIGLVIPFFYASLIWLVIVLRFYVKAKWLFVVISVAVFAVFLNLLVVLLEIRLPPALLTGLG